jgi:hypothetical protein
MQKGRIGPLRTTPELTEDRLQAAFRIMQVIQLHGGVMAVNCHLALIAFLDAALPTPNAACLQESNMT